MIGAKCIGGVRVLRRTEDVGRARVLRGATVVIGVIVIGAKGTVGMRAMMEQRT